MPHPHPKLWGTWIWIDYKVLQAILRYGQSEGLLSTKHPFSQIRSYITECLITGMVLVPQHGEKWWPNCIRPSCVWLRDPQVGGDRKTPSV